MNEISAEIIISADHGHQNCEKGRIAYGYDLYEPAVHIPLITPNYFGESEINFLVDQSQLMNIIINKKVEQKEFIYSDTRFYQQYDRKLSIYRNRYKYIYNKIDNSEELYDLDFDPHENVNLLIKNVPDFERKVVYPLDELYFYPHWEYAEKYYSILLNEKHKIWRQGNLIEETIDFLKSIIRNLLKKGIPWLFKRKRNTIKIKGRWDSNARIPSV